MVRPVGNCLTSSTQPISMMRSPAAGSVPVVSVSRTISRMRVLSEAGDPARHMTRTAGEGPKNIANLALGGREAAARVHKEMRPGPLLLVRHLLRPDRIQHLGREAGAGEHPGPLHLGRRGDDEHR